MKHFKFLMPFSFFIAFCGNSCMYNKDYYERISGLKIPTGFDIIETFDNLEFLTGTVFDCDSATLIQFIRKNNFDSLENVNDIRMWGYRYLKKDEPEFAKADGVFFVRKSKGKNHWTYIADLNTKRLWAEIGYPDWGGQ